MRARSSTRVRPLEERRARCGRWRVRVCGPGRGSRGCEGRWRLGQAVSGFFWVRTSERSRRRGVDQGDGACAADGQRKARARQQDAIAQWQQGKGRGGNANTVGRLLSMAMNSFETLSHQGLPHTTYTTRGSPGMADSATPSEALRPDRRAAMPVSVVLPETEAS